MITNLLLIFLSIFFSSAEAFLPIGSLTAAWAATLGAKRTGFLGVSLIFMMGIIRDVVMVDRIGISSIVLLISWAVSALGVAKFGHQLILVIGSAFSITLAFDLIAGQVNIGGVLISSIVSFIMFTVWANLAEKDNAIHLR